MAQPTDDARVARRRWLVRTMVAAVVLGLVLAVALAVVDGSAPRFPDEDIFATGARSLAAGDGYLGRNGEPTAARAPGLVLLLAPVALLTDAFVAMRFVGVLLFGVALVLTHRLGRHVSGMTTAHLATAGLAVSPLVVYTAGTLYPQAVAVVLLPAVAVVTLRLDGALERGESTTRPALALGALGGGLLLTAPATVSTLLAACGWLLWRSRARRPRSSERALGAEEHAGTADPGDAPRRASGILLAVRATALSFAVVLAMVAPWAIRNAIVFDTFVPIQSNVGVNLLLGSLPPDGLDALEDQRANEQLLDDALAAGETGEMRMLSGAFLERLRDEPGAVASQYMRKVSGALAPYDELAEDDRDGAAQRLVLTVAWVPVLALLALRAGLAVTGRLPLRRGEGLLVAIVVTNVLLTAFFVWRVRYRVPLDPLLLVLAVMPLATWFDRGGGAAGDDGTDGEPLRLDLLEQQNATRA